MYAVKFRTLDVYIQSVVSSLRPSCECHLQYFYQQLWVYYRNYHGLQTQRVSTAKLERPSIGVQRIPRQLPGPGSFHAGLDLET
uniref:Uncharacterized protein n=1 Tax=Xiphophorus couchianus TaxID=32473 RepID=A0A3B5MGN4_9TELE